MSKNLALKRQASLSKSSSSQRKQEYDNQVFAHNGLKNRFNDYTLKYQSPSNARPSSERTSRTCSKERVPEGSPQA